MKAPLKSMLFITCLAAGTASFAQTAMPADKAFVAKVSQGGMFEVAAGQLAMTKGSTQDIRDFATAEVHDHTLVGDKLKKVSGEAGITFSTTPNAEFSAKLKHLSSLSGSDFDKAYLAEMLDLHHKDGAAFAMEATNGGTADFKAFGAETHRIVLRHIGAIEAAPAK
jgi:putative membrane protein